MVDGEDAFPDEDGNIHIQLNTPADEAGGSSHIVEIELPPRSDEA